MKKILSILAIAALFVACGGEQKKSEDAENKGGDATATDATATEATADDATDVAIDEESSKGPQTIVEWILYYTDCQYDAVENDDYEAFKKAVYEVNKLVDGLSWQEQEAIQPELSEGHAVREDRYNRIAEKYDAWYHKAMTELSDEGLVMYHVE